LTFQVNVLFAIVEVAFIVFKLFLEIWLEGVLKVLLEDLSQSKYKDLLVQSECMLDVCDILEMDSVWNLETLHSIGVSPFLEMLLKRAGTPVACSTANLTLEFNPQAMQFVEPVRYGPSIPTHWKVLRIVLWALVLII
jgi:hypothetical protein